MRLVGLYWKVPDFSNLYGHQKALNVDISYHGRPGQLHLLIDASGIKAESEGDLSVRKYTESKECMWRKIHFGMDEETLETRRVRVSTGNLGDAPIHLAYWNKSYPTKKLPRSLLMVPMILVDGFVAQIGEQLHFPVPRTELDYHLSNRYTKSCVIVEDSYADFDFCDLPVEFPRHEALPQQFHAMHLGFKTASSVIPAPPSPEGAAEIS